MKYNNYFVVGLQRTGTNWLNHLIRDNFKIEAIPRDFKNPKYFWKHRTELPIQPKSQACKKPFVLSPDVFYIATSKDFPLWKISIDRKCVDVYRTHKTTNPKDLREIHDSWQVIKNKHLHEENFYYHNYIDWLNNWEKYLAEIAEITKWERKHSNFVNVTKNIEVNRNFDINNYSQYLK